MQVSSTIFSNAQGPAAAALALLGRLTASSPAVPASGIPGGPTAASVRTLLLEMGLAASEADVALASALVQAGLPLTAATLASAHAALANAPGVPPEAYTLAKTLALPLSPDALRALAAVLNAPARASAAGPGAVPETVRTWLGLALDAGTPPEALTRHLREMLLQIGRSTEHRVLTAELKDMPVADLRTSLLRLATASGDRALRGEADGLASLLEGQQLLNQASLTSHAHAPDTPLYFALPLAFLGQPSIAEVRLSLPHPEEGDEEAPLRVTLRLCPPRLGRVQADLAGVRPGLLTCRFGAERAGTARLLARHAALLVHALGGAGWPECEASCRVQTEWPPLWPGGEAFQAPRARVDQHV